MVPVLKESQIDSREFMALRNKSKIAFIHPSGLTLGGTERWLQMIAANLPKEEFEIDYFYQISDVELQSSLSRLQIVSEFEWLIKKRFGTKGPFSLR